MIELEGLAVRPLIGRKIGDIIDGSTIGLAGQKLRITGGTDKDGFPMRPDVHGGVKARIILAKGVGFHPRRKGERRRKIIRGRVVTEDIAQLNLKIVEKIEEKSEK